jgi:tetratricopeptide (TPR) repeat protein
MARLRSYEYQQFHAGLASDNASRNERSVNYLAAWALVHAALVGDDQIRDRFWRYLRTLASATADPGTAWTANFDRVAEGVLETRYLEAARGDGVLTARLPLPRFANDQIVERTMSSAEVLAMWSRQRADEHADQRAAVDQDLREALRLDPSNVDVRIRLAEVALQQQGTKAAREHLESAARSNPKEQRALAALLAHTLLEREAERTPSRDLSAATELGQRLAKVADSSLSWIVLCALELTLDRADRAASWAERAILSDSSCARCYVLVAAAYARSGKLEQAVRAQRIGINLRADGVSDQDARERLRKYAAKLARLQKHGG